jgi:hypothetical protein
MAAPTLNHRRGTHASTGNSTVTYGRIVLRSILLIGFILYQQDQLSWESASILEKTSLVSLVEAKATPPIEKYTFTSTSTSAATAAVTSTSFRSPVEIDIISIGSNTRPEYQDAQERTFGSHVAVRDFHRITEDNDSEAECHSSLQENQVQKIVRFCRTHAPVFDLHPHLKSMKEHYANFGWLLKKSNPPGWMCAQKRPSDGFFAILSSYKDSGKTIPDYLFITDDDTYVNMNEVSPFLQTAYPAHEAYAVAGCMIRSRVYEHNFTIPFGGWGTILTRPAIENFQKPLFCKQYGYNSKNITLTTAGDNDFTSLACWRLSQDPVGEASVFVEGMSVAELMHAYVQQFDYTAIDHWKPTSVGFCMHSDWVWGYFVNFYHIAVHGDNPKFVDTLEDRLRGYNGSLIYAGRQTKKVKAQRKECVNKKELCQASSHICHYITPDAMDKFHGAVHELAPNHYRAAKKT